MLKAVAGGGGRGMREVAREGEIAEAFARCRSEAASAFGDGALYAERLISSARHIEVQILGDAHGGLIALRRARMHDPAPQPEADRDRPEPVAAADFARAHRRRSACGSRAAALRQPRHLRVPGRRRGCGDEAWFAFIEANPRLQVEHTVTEEVFGVDLVQAQIRVAAGATPRRARPAQANRVPRGYAIQARVNLETMTASGEARAERRASSPPSSRPPAGRAGRRLRLCRLSRRRGLRFADRQGDRPFAVARFRRRGAPRRRARSASSASRACETNVSLPAGPADASRFRRRTRIDTRFIEPICRSCLKRAAREPSPHCYFERAGRTTAAERRRNRARGGRKARSRSAAPMPGAVVSVDVVDQATRCGRASRSP